MKEEKNRKNTSNNNSIQDLIALGFLVFAISALTPQIVKEQQNHAYHPNPELNEEDLNIPEGYEYAGNGKVVKTDNSKVFALPEGYEYDGNGKVVKIDNSEVFDVPEDYEYVGNGIFVRTNSSYDDIPDTNVNEVENNDIPKIRTKRIGTMTISYKNRG